MALEYILFTLLSSFSSYVIDFIYEITKIILSFFQIYLYKITSNNEINKFINKMEIKNFSSFCNNKPFGFFFGKWYIGKITTNDDPYNSSKTLYIYIKKDKYNDIQNIKSNDDIQTDTLSFWSRNGSYRYLYYLNRDIKLNKLAPNNNQQIILSDIKKNYSDKLIIYIYGDPGVGKSTIGYLLAKDLQCHFCDSWNPSDPNDNLDNVYNDINPDCNKPLILVLEEFDIIIDKFKSKFLSHKEYPIQVSDKNGWNLMLDKIQVGLYPNLILLLTSNKDPQYFKDIDPSLIREKRVNHIYHLKKIKEE